MIDISDLRAKLAAATPGEWWSESGVIHCKGPKWTPENHSCIHPCSCEDDEDGEFIAAAHNALPALLDEIEALRKLQEAADHWHSHPGREHTLGLIGHVIIDRETFDKITYALSAVREAQGRGK